MIKTPTFVFLSGIFSPLWAPFKSFVALAGLAWDLS
jgi:hypothetical protein